MSVCFHIKNTEALLCGIHPAVMTESHVAPYLRYMMLTLRDSDRETTVLCVGGPECQQLAARDADWLQVRIGPVHKSHVLFFLPFWGSSFQKKIRHILQQKLRLRNNALSPCKCFFEDIHMCFCL